MIFSKASIDKLREKVASHLSKKRYTHTLGVEEAAVHIATACGLENIDEIRAAALLHDISKEKSEAEMLQSINNNKIPMTDSDMLSPQIWHSIDAPSVIQTDFSEFATDNVLSAVRNHTVGAPDMSLFDEIIFVADYIESSRTYPACVDARIELYSSFDGALNAEECVGHLHRTTVRILENTIIHITETKRFLHERTVMTRNAFLGRLPMRAS